MLEIVALVFLTRNIGNLAAQKRLKIGWWKFYTVAAWFGAEFIGVYLLMILVPGSLVVAFLGAYGLAIASFFILRANLNSMPDAVFEDDISQIGSQTAEQLNSSTVKPLNY